MSEAVTETVEEIYVAAKEAAVAALVAMFTAGDHAGRTGELMMAEFMGAFAAAAAAEAT